MNWKRLSNLFFAASLFLGISEMGHAQDTLPGGRALKVLKLMGTRFEVAAYAKNDSIAWEAVRNAITEVQRIEALISSWDSLSQTSLLNRTAHLHAVKVDEELFQLIARSLKTSNLTQGAFDISFSAAGMAYQFDGKEHPLPEESARQKMLKRVGYRNIVLNREDTTVFFKKRGLRIGFGAMGKGYAANRARAVMRAIPGVYGGVINASGDLLAWGKSYLAGGWPIKIANPKGGRKPLAWLQTTDIAVVTSGSYYKFFTHQGKRYAHIINPHTGLPTTGIKSVTIITADAEIADSLATAVFVMGTDKGLALINKLPNVEALIINDEDEMLQSQHLSLNLN